ncbi:ATP-binding cassette subfamily F protein 3 [Melghiribacillus thermohalophilus]|uniref:ATP-binding cassette subfamily F protein 3 n=1 Tax=Melghiribacillus thermohalophilus TaxID=1324956 RepID=A0A4R3MT91_9BACI|nr:ABC-F type ribosomal protection protein [Melghiribacillus thermohalophilus]TCT18947.1 ATP-binding cassette subfamily F protein 3 [Melghiribacillus thermohalophilus]
MIVMQLNQITKFFGADLILSNIKLEVHNRDRIAIVGRNGAGKSTLLKIMAGELSHDDGEIYMPKDVTIGYLAQNTGLKSDLSIWDEMENVFARLKEMEEDLRKLEVKMGDPGLFQNQEAYEQLLKEYDEKQSLFKSAGGFQYEAKIKQVLNGLQFQDYDFDTPIRTLSGGQKTRLALGKLLLSKPDILILDEPTNHLDIETLNWLEQYLQSYDGAVIIVSHDRYFLDKTVTIVYEIAFQQSKKYTGNYSDYLRQKAKDYERDIKLYEKQQAEIKRLEEFIQKNIARDSTSKQAQSRRKQLEKMEKMDKPSLENRSAKFSFDIQRPSGNDVLKIRKLSFQYETDDDYIFQNVHLDLNRGDRVAIVGPNGIGKSTLLKTIVGQLKPSRGKLQYGTNVQIGYYDQEQTHLSMAKTVLNELWDEHPAMPEKDIRTVLGNFLFSGDDVLKPVSALSGGEKARLILAKLMLQKANFLVMDEPTNHLDLDSKEVLESALIDFPGTLLFVSHDRYFINRIAEKILELSDQGAKLYLGNYDYYLQKKQEEQEIQELNKKNDLPEQMETSTDYEQQKQEKRKLRKIRRQIEEVEREIESLEKAIAKCDEKMTDPELFHDYEALKKMNEEKENYQQQLDHFMQQWTELHEKMDDW